MVRGWWQLCSQQLGSSRSRGRAGCVASTPARALAACTRRPPWLFESQQPNLLRCCRQRSLGLTGKPGRVLENGRPAAWPAGRPVVRLAGLPMRLGSVADQEGGLGGGWRGRGRAGGRAGAAAGRGGAWVDTSAWHWIGIFATGRVAQWSMRPVWHPQGPGFKPRPSSFPRCVLHASFIVTPVWRDCS